MINDLRHRCEMYKRLFNTHLDVVVREGGETAIFIEVSYKSVVISCFTVEG